MTTSLATRKPMVAVTRRLPVEATRLLDVRCDLKLHDSVTPLGSGLVEFLREADAAILAPYDRIDAALLDACPRLKLLVNASAGFDNLDLDACTERGVRCANSPDAVTAATADFAIGLLIAAARRIGESSAHVKAGLWGSGSYESFMGSDVSGSTIGILGMGRIGQAIARRAALGFGMRVLAYSRTTVSTEVRCELKPQQVASKEELLREADHVVLALPLTAATRHIIGVSELALMRPSATLINVGRGGLIDEAALAEAVGARRIAAAALDVVESEPGRAEPLASIAEVLVTPHIASATVRTQLQTARQAAETVLAAFEGAGISRLLNPRVLTRKASAVPCPTA